MEMESGDGGDPVCCCMRSGTLKRRHPGASPLLSGGIPLHFKLRHPQRKLGSRLSGAARGSKQEQSSVLQRAVVHAR